MCIYFVLEVLMFVLVLYSFYIKQDKRNAIFAVVCFLWAIVWGFRALHVGNDTMSYANFFQHKNTGYYGTIDNPTQGFEPGFLFLMRIVLYFTNSPTIIFVLQSFWMFFVIYKLYTSVNPKFALWSFLFFLVFNWNYITLLSVAFRQALSVSILLYGLYYFNQKRSKYGHLNLKKSNKIDYLVPFAIMAIAAFIHKATLLFLPVIITTFFVRFNKKYSYITLISSFVISVFFFRLIGEAFDTAMLFFGNSDNNIISMFEHYSSTIEDTNSTLLSSLSRTFICLVIIYCTEKKQVGSVYFNNFVIAACLFNLLSFSLQSGRVLFIFTLFSGCLYIPSVVKRNKILRCVFILFTLLYMYRSYSAFSNWNSINSSDTTLPYNFIWE